MLITSLIEGLLSFMSPCILPLLPVYLGVLSGGDGDRDKTIENTLGFISGISSALLMLGAGFQALSKQLNEYKLEIQIISGVILLIFGIGQCGIFERLGIFQKEHKIQVNAKSNFIGCLALGFTFSFSWTPCIGPMLAGILAMTSATQNLAYIMVYMLGFTLPFLVLGVGSTKVLNFFKKKSHILAWTKYLGGVLMFLIGIYIILTSIVENKNIENSTVETVEKQSEIYDNSIYKFDLINLDGEYESLGNFKNKKLFINIWATWCGPCKAELPEIEALSNNRDDIVVIGIEAGGADLAEIKDFTEKNGLTYKILVDNTEEFINWLGVQAFPTTIIVDEHGEIINARVGSMKYQDMESLIEEK